MKRLTLILLLCLLTALPALAQTPQPTAVSTPGITPSDEPAPTPPAPEAEGTPEAPVIPTSVIIDYLESQPDLMVDIAEVAIAGVGAAYERSQWTGIAAFAGLAVVTCAGFYALYRSTPPDQRPAIGRQLGAAGSAILGGIDKIDLIPGTDIDNLLFRAGKKALDDRIAAIDAIVEAKVQSLYEAEKERKRANEAAKLANEALNGDAAGSAGRAIPLNLVPPPDGPANPSQG